MKHAPSQWKQDYERDGYLVVPDLVDPQTLEQLRRGVEKITSAPDAVAPHLKMHLDMERDYIQKKPQYNELDSGQVGNAIRNIMELPLFDPVFADVICYQPLLDVLEALFDSREFHYHNYKCINKAPAVSSTFCWHRDLPYLQHSSPNLITAMLCLDPMTPDNGATVVLPKSHRIPHEKVTDSDMDIAEKDLPTEFEQVQVCCPPGSAVLFHVNIIHGGPANRSTIPRRNIIGIWAGPETYPTTPARYAYQGLYPRSEDISRQRQMAMTFPHLASAARLGEQGVGC